MMENSELVEALVAVFKEFGEEYPEASAPRFMRLLERHNLALAAQPRADVDRNSEYNLGFDDGLAVGRSQGEQARTDRKAVLEAYERAARVAASFYRPKIAHAIRALAEGEG